MLPLGTKKLCTHAGATEAPAGGLSVSRWLWVMPLSALGRLGLRCLSDQSMAGQTLNTAPGAPTWSRQAASIGPAGQLVLGAMQVAD